METLKIAYIGMGYRGKQLLALCRHIPYFQITAIADPEAREEVYGVPCYHRGGDDYQRMIATHAPQLVFIASPWQLHVTHALYCLKAGCHVALEIKGGLYLHEYQPLLEAADACGKKVFPLENTLFRQEVLAMYNLVREGALGEIVHLRGGYRHDLRNLLLDDKGNMGNRKKTESIWRSKFYLQENGDLYPTHGLAPLCLIAGIPRKDRLVCLTSFSSKAAGLHQRIRELGGDEQLAVAQGDIVLTQLETASGVLISLTHDTTLPRPRSLDLEVQGTKGIWQGELRRIYLEGRSPHETWEPDTPYLQQYAHTYWKRWGEEALRLDTHHEGMDYIMLKALEAGLKQELAYPADLRDLALWTSVTPLSIQSIAEHKTVSME